MKRVLCIVLDSVGCGNAAEVATIGMGEIPDAGRWIEERMICH